MKFNLVILLVGSAMAIALITTPTAAHAQLANPERQQNIQAVLATLDLSEDQKDELEAIRTETRSQIEAILTSDQKLAFQAAIAEAQNPQEALQSLDLSAEQKDQLQAIKQSSRQQISSVLTAEQRRQLRQELRSRRRSGGFRRSN
ncbi:MAG: P pilus assembly/Cpx signaling pathway, periplasmic inhibitor/zinc-resistance associated protein [Cyanothece sp. SIO1E1]|nr:P pilus assembly/Cpx signaling pathway, periplasmic inhibitor/zinc-resistance associated protein [Cyanothece sp. SIO1E1]